MTIPMQGRSGHPGFLLSVTRGYRRSAGYTFIFLHITQNFSGLLLIIQYNLCYDFQS
ncbi:hypothetical protein CBFG_05974 [Clostridiales bacterium 1_7_47FAA]|nr:hypothetical protein CBFG_05974 [Clostridiales bacterium 1_7_47FAA]